MFTYQRKDGSYYDAEKPEDAGDLCFPLRPSDIHRWNGKRWVWVSPNGVRHTYPDENDFCADVTPATLADFIRVFSEHIETQEYQSRAIGEMRGRIADLSHQMQSHLQEAGPLMATLKDLQSFARLATNVGRLIKGVWKFVLVVMALYFAVWALVHGDIGALRRAIAIM